MRLRSIVFSLALIIGINGSIVQNPPVNAATEPPLHNLHVQPHIPVALPNDDNVAQPLPQGTTPKQLISQLPNVRPISDLLASDAPQATAVVSAPETYILDFEDDWTNPNNPNWIHQDFSGSDGGEYFWGKRDCNVFNGSFSAFSAGGGAKGSTRSCSSKYPKNAQSDALFGYLNLTPFQSGTATIYFKGQSEGFTTQSCTEIHDYLFFGLGPQFSDNVRGRRHCGPWDSGFFASTIDLSSLPNKVLGTSQVLFELFFYSDDDSLQGTGFSIDYVTFTLERTPPIRKVYVPMSRKYTGPSIVACPDTEPNDIKTQGKLITKFGVACQGSLHQQRADDTSDFYAVDVGANQKLIIDLNNFGKNDYDLYLYSATSDQALAQSANNTGLAEHLEYTNASARRLYIWVVGREPYISPYTYNLTVRRQ